MPELAPTSENKKVKLKCQARGDPAPKIEWSYNGKPIEEAPYDPRRTVDENLIIINHVKRSDIGNYGCNASNEFGYVYKEVSVNFAEFPPVIDEIFDEHATVDGRDVTLRCEVFGAPKPKVKWTRNGKDLTADRFEVQKRGNLKIRAAKFSDAGRYTCHARNEFGEKEASGKLTVYKSTKIIEKSSYVKALIGSEVTFHCSAVSDPLLPYQIQWRFNGEKIKFRSDSRIIQDHENSLTISDFRKSDTGSYKCIAITDLDEDSYSVNLYVASHDSF